MTIGELARASGVNAKMIRHYESIGLVPRASRTESGYRIYSGNDVQFLKFIKRARRLGFNMTEIKKLIGLWRNKSRASKEVKAMALGHIKELERKIEEMRDMADSLRGLAKNCHGDARPECPILRGLENDDV
jgi:MerR family gold-responsive transcriptional activator of gol and ges genes